MVLSYSLLSIKLNVKTAIYENKSHSVNLNYYNQFRIRGLLYSTLPCQYISSCRHPSSGFEFLHILIRIMANIRIISTSTTQILQGTSLSQQQTINFIPVIRGISRQCFHKTRNWYGYGDVEINISQLTVFNKQAIGMAMATFNGDLSSPKV